MPEDLSETIMSIGEIATLLYDLEGASETMVDWYFQHRGPGVDDKEVLKRIRYEVGELEFHAKSLRIYLTRLQSTIMVHNFPAMVNEKTLEDMGFAGYVDGEAIEIAIPYSFVTSTATFLFFIKRFEKLKNLMQNTSMWHMVMRMILEKLKPHAPFKLPLKHASLEIVVFKPQKMLGDPDHFWLRPVIDAFVNNRFILNDDAMSLDIYTTYQTDKEKPEIRLRLKKKEKKQLITVRNEQLIQVWGPQKCSE